MKKLERPEGLVINFSPSSKQYMVWNALQGNRCDKCGGQLSMELTGYDKQGHPIHEPTCKNCKNTDIPELILAGGSAGGGKGEQLDAIIMTPYGEKRFGDLKVGDAVTDPMTGGIEYVEYLHPIEIRDYYRLHFIDGTFAEVSDNHIWRLHITRYGSGKKKDLDGNNVSDRLWVTTHIYDWMQEKKEGKHEGANLTIPLCAPVHFSVETQTGGTLPLPPYFLGCLIGNGCMSASARKIGVSLTTQDAEMIKRISNLGYVHDRINHPEMVAPTYIYKQAKLQNILDSLNLMEHTAYDKFIPEQYKYASVEHRKELMQGLIDTDGYVDSRGHISYCTTSQQLAEDIAFIIRGLGGKATIKSKIPTYTYKGEKKQGHIAYTVYIMTKCDKDLAYVPRKKDLCRNEYNGGNSELCRRIVDIEYIGKKEGRCITVNNPHGLYLTNDFIVTHNSFLGCSWVVKSCLEYPGIRMVLARKELKNLLSTTWSTMIGVLNNWGLKQDIHYHINNQRIVLTFWNGSTISGLELAPSLQDPDYARLGSLEITGGFIDEASEVLEKAVEVLQSRIRYRIAETFVVGKLLLCSNPSQNWIRSVFVQDDDGNPVRLKKGYRYLPFSLFDNPDENFRMIYFNRLRKIRDKATRQRLLYGNWDYVEANKMSAYYNFDGDKHIVQNLQDKKYNPMRPLILSFDFNVNPYMSCLPIQINWEEKEVYIFREIIGKPDEKNNNAPAFGRFVAKSLRNMSTISNLLVTGDPAGLARSSQTEAGVNNYTIITKALNAQHFQTTLQLFRTQPSQISRLDFMNELLNGYNSWHIFIDIACRRLVDDLVYQKKNPDGTKEKKKVLMENGTRAEKYGHLSDCFDYALCYYLSNDYNIFINGGIDEITTIASDDMYGDFDY